MNRIILSLFLLMTTLCVCAQKKDISQARDYIKKNNNLEKAETMMSKLLKDTANINNKKIWLTMFEAQKKQYEQGNEKLYLKQKYDTGNLFNLTKRMFQTLESFDSVEMRPERNGKVKIEYRKKHSEFLNSYRRNLYLGGIYYANKQKYKEAYSFFDQYIDCANQPLFEHYNYLEKDTLMPVAAYWSVYCGYKMKDPKATLHHSYLALKDQNHYHLMLQYLAETYKLEGDTARYMQTLKEGFDKYPTFPYFFPHLIAGYAERNDWSSAMKVCNQALNADSQNKLFRFTKSSVLLNTGKYEESIKICSDLIKEDSLFTEAYFNIGLSYYNQGVELGKSLQTSKSLRNKMQNYYRKALPYLEKYRSKEPDQIERWGLPLYTIYLNLNMGKQFDEIDKLMQNTNKK